MDYLKEFLNLEEYETYKDGEDFTLPNVSLINEPYSVKYTPYTPPNYFRITNLENIDGDIALEAVWSSSYPQDEFFPITIEYCINGDGVWTSITDNRSIVIPIPAKGYVELRGDNISMCNYNDDYNSTLFWNLQVEYKHNLSGDIMSICGFSDTLEDFHFYRFFENDTTLIDASNLILSANTLKQHCYDSTFRGCTNLVNAPKLPATTLANSCYYCMFFHCTNIISAPSTLPATTLARYCYSSMFSSCTSLTSAPALPATTLATDCYYSMFFRCTSLTSAPALPATTLATDCYYSMFNGCTSLTTAPALPATTLASNCYYYMFSGCTNLNYIKAMFTTTPSDTYTLGWVNGVASSGTFIKNPAATWDVTGNNGVPTGWTVQTASE